MRTYPPDMPAVSIVADALQITEPQVWDLVECGAIEIVDTRLDEPPAAVQMPLEKPRPFR